MAVHSFSDLRAADSDIAGSKGANLGELTSTGVSVPLGLVITVGTYDAFITETGLAEYIAKFTHGLDYTDLKRVNFVAGRIRQIIGAASWPIGMASDLEAKFAKFGVGKSYNRYAVRSSAIGEDSEGTSFAGQHSSFLNIPAGDILKKVKQCFASLFEPRALAYRLEKGLSLSQAQMAVVVQQMAPSRVAGVMFTQDPTTGNSNQIIIEAVWGLGEAIVSGAVTPDHYEVSKRSLQVKGQAVAEQRQKLTDSGWGRNYDTGQKLPMTAIAELAEIGKQLEKHFGCPQDIEWSYDNSWFYILQARPVTTQGKAKTEVSGKPVLAKGSAACFGVGTGPVRIITHPSQLDQVQQGDILVTSMTTPDYVPVFGRIAGLVTDLGGTTCHAAIISREFDLPCVVGTGTATSQLSNGQVVTVDGGNGIVQEG